ncbi:MAG: Dihydrolipoamide dehydrogenase of 2-oxoglutarate dehydrogenase [uncultured Gemmatimonadetes bacterium]|uniref:Dihydrolipoyl dehydrogenase n=1 Tax=uncultured Gemmatimonadota bacterium TaxID=203437 RepID=A0A6J4L9B8_9BACT|nr:MAG: Dihydrolipoamide dehydrogenase of 2-oxoglutarate dehydrogenase [uncultured Gemmatimonadota bacterium]
MADELNFDLVVLGGGPGGYVAAIRAAQLGFKTACIEKEPALGGTCLRVGCIPSKALLDSSELFEQIRHKAELHGIRVEGATVDVPTMLARKDGVVKSLTQGVAGLFRKNKIEWIRGFGRMTSPETIEVTGENGTQTVRGKTIILAPGSVPVELPFLKFDHERIIDSTGAQFIPAVPEHLVIVGGGVIGMELGSVWLRLGARVTILEAMPSILTGLDGEVVKTADRVFRKQGFDIRTGARVTGAERRGDKVIVSVEGQEPIEADYLLVSVGRRAYTEGMGFEEVGIRMERGVIQVDEHFRTGVGNVFAIGDAIGGRMLAHKAEDEGVAAVETAAGKHGHVNYDAVANIVYTWPEIASVGATEEELRERGVEYKTGKFPFLANGRAKAMGETDGFVKILADAKTDRMLGAHIIGPRASDLIAQLATAIEFQSSAEDIARTVHAHPTLPEAVKEAALGVDGRMIHL